MSTIIAILEPDPDGSLHLPPELRDTAVKVCDSAEPDRIGDVSRATPSAIPNIAEI
jgi:hypothetical protein